MELHREAEAEAEIEDLMGGKPDILGGYFGVLLPAVFSNGTPLKVTTTTLTSNPNSNPNPLVQAKDGSLLHFWLQVSLDSA